MVSLPFRPAAMFRLYTGALDIPVWTLAVPTGVFVLHPTAETPGGPVTFTSRAAAQRFLDWHEVRFGPLDATRTAHAATLGELVERWRAHFAAMGYQPRRYSAIVINPAGRSGKDDTFVADALPIDPTTIPAGVEG